MKKQHGFTLIEIMIALTLGLIVLGAVISIYVATVSSSSSIIKSARLNHDLNAVMALMINDIKRAGYWGGATVAADSRANPFTATTTNLQILTANDCILYSYDANGNGSVDTDEYYGFKLAAGTIQMRKTGATTADCSNGTWEEFIDGAQLDITTLQFSFSAVSTPSLPATSRCLNVTNSSLPSVASSSTLICAANGTIFPIASQDNLAEKRLVNIQLAGRLDTDITTIKTLNRTLEVRNSRLYTQQP